VAEEWDCATGPPSKALVLILWWLWEVFTSMCEPDENRILREERRNPNELANNPRRHVGSRR
jgi:hypothetical protein